MFCISTKGRYSTRILVLLAMAGPDGMLTKNEIAELEGLTPGYVQQLTSHLQTVGLVTSYRGKRGGFRLAVPPDELNVADVLRATEGLMRLAPCFEGDGCDRATICATREVWDEASKLLTEFLEQKTIAWLAERAGELAQISPADMMGPREQAATPVSQPGRGERRKVGV